MVNISNRFVSLEARTGVGGGVGRGEPGGVGEEKAEPPILPLKGVRKTGGGKRGTASGY